MMIRVTPGLRSKVIAAGASVALMVLLAPSGAVSTQGEVETAKVRVLHGSSDAPAVDVHADGGLIGEDLAFTQITAYLPIPGGTYRIQIVPTGARLEEGPAIIDEEITFEAGTMTTVAVTGGRAEGIVLQVIADTPAPSSEGTQVRVVHLSIDAPAFDIATDGGDVVVRGLPYPVATEYLSLPAGGYDLEIRHAGTTDAAFDIEPLDLEAGHSYSAFAVGDLADGSFTVVPAIDAALAGVRVLHGSADAPAVDVYANGGAVLTDVSFGVISDYLYVPAGGYRIQMVPTGASLEDGLVVIDEELTFETGTMTTLAATGVRATVTLRLVRDSPAPVADKAQVRVVHLSPDAPTVDVAPDDSVVADALVRSLEPGKASRYVTVDPGEYDLDVRPAGRKRAAFDIPPFTFEAGTSYSAFAIGQLGAGSFTVILVEDAAATR